MTCREARFPARSATETVSRTVPLANRWLKVSSTTNPVESERTTRQCSSRFPPGPMGPLTSPSLVTRTDATSRPLSESLKATSRSIRPLLSRSNAVREVGKRTSIRGEPASGGPVGPLSEHPEQATSASRRNGGGKTSER